MHGEFEGGEGGVCAWREEGRGRLSASKVRWMVKSSL